MENSNEKNKMDGEIENCGCEKNTNKTRNEKTLDELTITKICKSNRCSICMSENMLKMHNLRKAGKKLDEIVEIIKNEYNEIISPASLSRHFKSLTNRRVELSAEILNADLINDATKLAAHTRAVVELIDIIIPRIKQRIIAGTLKTDLKDLDIIMKMRYQLLNGQTTENSDFLAIFQKATDKYGVNLAQATLFATSSNNRAPEQEDNE